MAPPELIDACSTDANAEGRCLCGNCTNGAITQTCLRYTKNSTGNWILTGCLPGSDCGRVFPELKPNDYVASCPCPAPKSPFKWRPWLLGGGRRNSCRARAPSSSLACAPTRSSLVILWPPSRSLTPGSAATPRCRRAPRYLRRRRLILCGASLILLRAPAREPPERATSPRKGSRAAPRGCEARTS